MITLESALRGLICEHGARAPRYYDLPRLGADIQDIFLDALGIVELDAECIDTYYGGDLIIPLSSVLAGAVAELAERMAQLDWSDLLYSYLYSWADDRYGWWRPVARWDGDSEVIAEIGSPHDPVEVHLIDDTGQVYLMTPDGCLDSRRTPDWDLLSNRIPRSEWPHDVYAGGSRRSVYRQHEDCDPELDAHIEACREQAQSEPIEWEATLLADHSE